MLLFELMEKLRLIEETFWPYIPVHIKIQHIDEVAVFSIVVEKKGVDDYLIILE